MKLLLALGGLCLLLISCSSGAYGRWGTLHVANRQLVDQQGKPVQLRGFSTYNIAGFDWLFGVPQTKELSQVWHADVLRIAMYTDSNQAGYVLDPGKGTVNPSLKRLVERVIANTEKAGLYAILDWHILYDGDPMTDVKEACAFFSEMAKRYRGDGHLLFEICNEPNGSQVTWKGDIRPYAVQVLAAIRAVDPQRIVLVGTPNWSTQPADVLEDPLPDSQVMYVFHVYMDKGAELQAQALEALKKVPLIVTEIGTTDSSGKGDIHPNRFKAWMNFLNEHRISWCNWSLSTVAEGSAALQSNYELNGPMKDHLSPSGKLVFPYLANPRN